LPSFAGRVFFLSFYGHGNGLKDGQFYIFPSDIQGSLGDTYEFKPLWCPIPMWTEDPRGNLNLRGVL
jgi:hypothetical protein